jgi:DNA-binding NtrC family response regulator
MDSKYHSELDLRVGDGPLLMGESPAMQDLRSRVDRLAGSRDPVLVHGETGTGKERVARQLHRRSDRATGPFLSVHALSLTPGFFEGGAEAADGGTLFIDGIEELAEASQAALLRFLQAAGDDPALPQCRLVSASLLPAEQLVRQGVLRPDLANRLSTLRLEVPPLRDRREDLPALASAFLVQLGGSRGLRLSDAAAAALVLHSWPGNVRELRNRLAQAALVADEATLTPHQLGLALPGQPQSLSLREMRRAAEREAITRALRQSQGQVPAAAAALDISRAQLYRLISRLGLDHHSVAESASDASRGTGA